MGKNDPNQSDCIIFKSTISPEQISTIALFFLHVGTNSQKLKVDQKHFGWA